MYKKPIIVFEGIEGSGKTHHLNLITSYLKKRKFKYICLREPGGSKNSEKIRNLILNNKSNFNKDTDLLLYLAARSENLNLLRKNHKKKIILIDRFIDSTIAYQHYGFGIDISLIKKINKYLLKNLKVEFTFTHIVDHKNMILRLKKRNTLNRYDKFKKEFYTKVQNGFIKLAQKNSKRYQIINSNLEISKNKNLILKKFEKLIK